MSNISNVLKALNDSLSIESAIKGSSPRLESKESVIVRRTLKDKNDSVRVRRTVVVS